MVIRVIQIEILMRNTEIMKIEVKKGILAHTFLTVAVLGSIVVSIPTCHVRDGFESPPERGFWDGVALR